MGNFETHSERYFSLEKDIALSKTFYHKTAQNVLDTAMDELDGELNLVPVVDEEEKAAKLINQQQNVDNNSDLIPPDISNELGYDYVKEDFLTVKKKQWKIMR